MLITPEQVQQYHEQGYCILERAIPQHHLDNLRAECGRFIDMMHQEMDRQGTDTLGINHRNKRYFVGLRHKESAKVTNFLFSDTMAAVTQALLGENVYLFYEQYVVKAAEVGMEFSWHQDSGYVNKDGIIPHKPYLSCWCPLDDVNEANGTVYVLPYTRAETKEFVMHSLDARNNDRVGYFGNDPGVPVIVPAGSIVAFSSVTFHRSGPNTTDKMRRVYLAQYSPEIIRKPSSDGQWGLAEPFIVQGQRVANASQ